MESERRSRNAVPIGDILDAYLAETERSSVKPLAQVRHGWESLVQSKKLNGTRVASFKEGKVTIEVKSPPLLAELAQFRRKELLLTLQSTVSPEVSICDLRFRLSAW